MSKFAITKEKDNNTTIVKLANLENGEYVTCLVELGATLGECQLLLNGKLRAVLDAYTSEKDFKETLYSSFKGSKLFPYPNRIAKGVYSFEDEEHTLKLNSSSEPHAIHGLVYDMPFSITEETANDNMAKVSVTYSYTGGKAGFPFSYELTISYILSNKGLECLTEYKNTGDKNMPVGDGWHPYFLAGNSVNTAKLKFLSDRLYLVDDTLIPLMETKEYRDFNELTTIADTQFDSCFGMEVTGDTSVIQMENTEEGYSYDIWIETGENKYNFVQIYTPPARKSIAIEPMTCIPDVFNNGEGLITLAPGEEQKLSWGIVK